MSRPPAWLRRLERRLGPGRVRRDPASLLACESDALTLFRCRPSAVVLPASEEEVAEAVRLLHQAGVPFAARGAGTGLSGGALVPEGGVLLALGRLDRILELRPREGLARAQPGVVNLELSRAAEPYGLRYAPDPASQQVCTLGGNVAENSGGPHCFAHGMTGNHVLFLDVVLPDGRHERWGSEHAEDGSLDLRGFCVGSEGTVAVVTGIGVRLLPLPEAVHTFFGAFDSIQTCCAAVSEIVARGLTPVALEVLDRRAIHAVESSVYRAGYPLEAGAVLLVEVEGPAPRVRDEAREIEEVLRRHDPLRIEQAETPERRRALWKGRKGAGGAVGRYGPDTYVMDGVVPRSRLAEVMAWVDEVQEAAGLPVANLFHAGDGNLHPLFSYDARDPAQARAVEEAGRRILLRCLELGGSLSGEHGIGLEKEALLGRQFDAATLGLMERVRRVFNPRDLLNPGKGLPLGRGCAEAFHRHGEAAAAPRRGLPPLPAPPPPTEGPPPEARELLDFLREAREAGRSLLPRGRGSRLDRHLPGAAPGAWLELAGLDRIHTLDAADQTCEVGAGCSPEVLDQALEEHGLELGADAPGAATGTLGGLFLAPDLSLLHGAWGPPRDQVLGGTWLLADGTVVRTGARVVKSVAGYDLTRLFLGSRGRLAACLRLILRLRPRPRRPRWLRLDAGRAAAWLQAPLARRPPCRRFFRPADREPWYAEVDGIPAPPGWEAVEREEFEAARARTLAAFATAAGRVVLAPRDAALLTRWPGAAEGTGLRLAGRPPAEELDAAGRSALGRARLLPAAADPPWLARLQAACGGGFLPAARPEAAEAGR